MAQESIENEIKWLEEQLEAKRRALQESGSASAEAADGREREMIKDVIKEAAEPTSNLLPPTSTISDDDAQKAAFLLKEKEHEQIIQDLVVMALTKGIASALKVVRALNNPHILDEFHDTLADKFYEKLLQARKIK